MRLIIFLTALLITAALSGVRTSAQDVSSEKIPSTPATTDVSFEIDFAKHPLKPPDTSSPRATLRSFIDNMNRSYRVLMAAHDKNMNTPGLFTPQPVQQMARRAEELIARGIRGLNLSEVPTALKENLGHDKALLLKEILDRIELPPYESIPDAEAIEKEQKQEKMAELVRWRIPNTEIFIARVEQGPRKGQFLFTPQTVDRLDEFYEKVRHLPYKSDALISDGFLEFYTTTPGRLLPPKWSRWLPAWSTQIVLGQTLWRWGVFAVSLLFLFWSNMALFRRIQSRAGELPPAKRLWRKVFFTLFAFGTILLLLLFYDQVKITGSVLILSRSILAPVGWFLLASGAFFTGQAIAETIIASPKIDPEGIQASYLRAVFGVVGFVAAAAIIVYGISRFGVSLIPLLTGLGIGGLAIGLAARPAFENIISSFMIFIDKPFRVGQRIKVMGQHGTVESIGLRSSKIRLLTGHLTSIPNKRIADVDVENIGRRPHIRRLFNVAITYDTPPEKIIRGLEIIREILAVPEAADAETADSADDLTEGKVEKQPHPNEAINQPEFKPRIYFNEFKADSLNILVIYWYHPPNYWDYLEHATWVNIQIKERFDAEGIDFAFPTQTLHMAGDDKRPLTVAQRWVSKEEAFSSGEVESVALGAQAVQIPQTPASEAVRPQTDEIKPPKAEVDGELTDAPLEDEVLHGGGESEVSGDGEDER